MKICFISPGINSLLYQTGHGTGGAERQFMLYGLELTKRGHSIAYITKDPGDQVPMNPESAQFKIEFADFSWMNHSKWKLISWFFSLVKAMKRVSCDVYIIKTPAIALLPMLFYRIFNKARIVFWTQIDDDACRNRKRTNATASAIMNWTIPKTDLVIAQTEDQQKNYLKNFQIQAFHIPNIFSPDIDSGGLIESDVFWCGNSSVKKRPFVVFELAKRLPHLHFLMAMNVSSSDIFSQVKEMAEQYSNVTFLGSIPPSKTASCFRGCRVYLNTSKEEGFPNTFLQTWNAGKPVLSVCIDPDGVLERYQLGKCLGRTAELASSEDYAGLAEQLEKPLLEILSESPEQYKRNGVSYIQEHHSPDKICNQVNELFSTIV